VPQNRWGEISDDAIRYSSPVGFSTRVVTNDKTVIGGCPISRGQILVISPFAANRDPAVFGSEPGRIMPRQKTGVGMAFAAGAHICVGLRISRSIVRGAYDGLAELPPLKLAGRGTQGTGKVVRVLDSLPIELQ
jgi:cytochrome P450